MYANKRVTEITQQIAQRFHRDFNSGARLIWFGSWIKGNASLQSDIDLAIQHTDSLDSKQMLSFQDYIDEFATLYTIDLVDMNCANDRLKKEIMKYGKAL